jgi:Skp family chaperone for outer membrane proteins
MKRYFFFCLFFATSLVSAQVATVNVTAVIKTLPIYEKLHQDHQKEYSIASNKLQAKKEQLEGKMHEIETKNETMSEQRLSRLRREAQSLRRELLFMDEDLQKNLSSLEQEIQAQLMQEASTLINNYAKEHNIDLVLSHDLVISVSDKVDITDNVIASLRKVEE